MHCPRCGQPTSETDVFCRSCGASTRPKAPMQLAFRGDLREHLVPILLLGLAVLFSTAATEGAWWIVDTHTESRIGVPPFSLTTISDMDCGYEIRGVRTHIDMESGGSRSQNTATYTYDSDAIADYQENTSNLFGTMGVLALLAQVVTLVAFLGVVAGATTLSRPMITTLLTLVALLVATLPWVVLATSLPNAVISDNNDLPFCGAPTDSISGLSGSHSSGSKTSSYYLRSEWNVGGGFVASFLGFVCILLCVVLNVLRMLRGPRPPLAVMAPHPGHAPMAAPVHSPAAPGALSAGQGAAAHQGPPPFATAAGPPAPPAMALPTAAPPPPAVPP